MARDAGRLRALLGALLLAVICALDAGAQAPEDRAERFLIPVTSLVGGFTDARGGAAPRYIKLINPGTMAAFGNDLYIADRGSGTLLRLDVGTQQIRPLVKIPLAGPIKLRAGPDGSIYLLLPNRAEILRMTPGGETFLRYGDIGAMAQPVDMVLEPLQHRLWVLDASGDLFEFMPLGRLLGQIGDLEHGPMITMFAPGPRTLLSLDVRCQCIARLDSAGFVVARFAQGAVRQPAAAEVDRYGRLWVVDLADGLLKIFSGEQLIASLRPISLGMAAISALTFDFDRAYLADGLGGRVLAFSLLPPAEAPR